MIAQLLQGDDLAKVQDALGEGLESLGTAIDDLTVEETIDLGEIRERLATIDDLGGEQYIRAYVELAGRVIETRVQGGTGQLSTLPVPPYDLMLPFKARDLLKGCGPQSPRSQVPVYNRKVDTRRATTDKKERLQGVDTKR